MMGAFRNFKPQSKTSRLFDSGGLYLEVPPSGGRWWWFKDRSKAKEKQIPLEVFAEVSIKEAGMAAVTINATTFGGATRNRTTGVQLYHRMKPVREAGN